MAAPVAARGPVPEAPRAGWFERGFVIFGMTIYLSAITGTIGIATGTSAATGQTEISNTIAQTVILVVLAILLWVRRAQVLRQVRPLAPYLALLALCMVSALWSDFPATTLRRSASLGLCIGFGVYCHVALGLAGTIRLAAWTAVLLAILSLLLYAAAPVLASETAEGYEGALRGVFVQKNICAEAMMLAVPCWAYCWTTGTTGRLTSLSALALLFLCIVLSESASSLIISCAALATFMVMSLSPVRRRQFAPALLLGGLMGAALVFLFVLAPASVLAMIGRDPTLTGRSPVWAAALDVIPERLWLGHGFAAFWNVDSTETKYIWQLVGWRPSSAHSGYLDLILQLGLVGLIPCLWLWGRILWLACPTPYRPNPPEAKWVLAALLTGFLISIDEIPLPSTDLAAALTATSLLYLEALRAGSVLRGRDLRRRLALARRAPEPA